MKTNRPKRICRKTRNLFENIRLSENRAQFLADPMQANFCDFKPLNNYAFGSKIQLLIISDHLCGSNTKFSKTFLMNTIFVKDVANLFSGNGFRMPSRLANDIAIRNLRTLIAIALNIENTIDIIKFEPLLSIMYSQDNLTLQHPIVPLFYLSSKISIRTFNLLDKLTAFAFYYRNGGLSIGWGLNVELMKSQFSTIINFRSFKLLEKLQTSSRAGRTEIITKFWEQFHSFIKDSIFFPE